MALMPMQIKRLAYLHGFWYLLGMDRLNAAKPTLRGPAVLIQLLLRQFVCTGDRVVDATCGNGKDTLLLAELVGTAGQVYALDIQPEALARTSQRLTDAGLSSQVTLLNQGHQLLTTLVPPGITAVVFNLGWLPGGDRALITRPETTLPALEGSLQLLRAGGLLAITCYPGHTGGHTETSSEIGRASCRERV